MVLKKAILPKICSKGIPSSDFEECFATVPLFWKKVTQSEIIPRLCTLLNQEPRGLLGVSTCMNGKNFRIDGIIIIAKFSI